MSGGVLVIAAVGLMYTDAADTLPARREAGLSSQESSRAELLSESADSCRFRNQRQSCYCLMSELQRSAAPSCGPSSAGSAQPHVSFSYAESRPETCCSCMCCGVLVTAAIGLACMQTLLIQLAEKLTWVHAGLTMLDCQSHSARREICTLVIVQQ